MPIRPTTRAQIISCPGSDDYEKDSNTSTTSCADRDAGGAASYPEIARIAAETTSLYPQPSTLKASQEQSACPPASPHSRRNNLLLPERSCKHARTYRRASGLIRTILPLATLLYPGLPQCRHEESNPNRRSRNPGRLAHSRDRYEALLL
jgi:hypothetical protein